MTRRSISIATVIALVLAVLATWGTAANAAAPAGSVRVQAAASIVVTPATDLVEGQTVSVEGIGWVPGNTIGVCQAIELDPPGAANCHQGLYTSVIADSLGGFTVELTVHAEIDVPSLGHVVDCTDPSQPCFVGAADGADVVGTVMAVPIAFTPPTATVPGYPTGVSAVAGAGEVTVSWTAPGSNGGSPLTGYWVTGYVGYWPTVLVKFESTATSQVITGLSAGTTYWFRVRAVNAIGRSALSGPTALVTPTA